MPVKAKVKNKSTTVNKKKTKKKPRRIKRKTWQEEDRESLETLEFIKAIDKYKRRTQKAFPAWSEILRILKALGYRKV